MNFIQFAMKCILHRRRNWIPSIVCILDLMAMSPVIYFYWHPKASDQHELSCEHIVSINNSVQTIYVFGDSTVDAGNNNLFDNAPKANFFSYGIDFNKTPTGRLTNGETIADYVDNDP
ncbi:hypothetical protein U1Q18_016668 [Sarracenia purpurea var. burkii]